ncbi:lysozyme family protein [Sneathiella aquimaris]|uniref:hypothetical protein n=1 Tax=Sneathiella aquimaris TaxID=2599305 RepID=UPI00146E61F1|nr:hypothetical protein [Sneathiella aquimaris]
MFNKFFILVLTTLIFQTVPVQAAQFPANGAEFLNTCRSATERTEKSLRLPKRLLNAISLAETGRWHKEKREIIAWPWTVYSEGRGRYLPSKAAAIAEVKKLKKKGVKNIDVGCMQVNLHWHPNAFTSLEEAFDPTVNASYAGALLKKLQRKNRSWNIAVAHYHSQTKKFNIPYKKKVLKLWQEERRRDTALRMEKAREQYRKRRALIDKRREAILKKKQEALQLASNS